LFNGFLLNVDSAQLLSKALLKEDILGTNCVFRIFPALGKLVRKGDFPGT